MGNRFHLAIPAGDLDKAINFYCEILGCERGNAEFKYPVPHFGVHLDAETFKKLKKRLIDKKIKFIDPPYIRFKGEDIEQETMFLEDTNGNCMEIKSMKNPNTLFKK